MSNLANVLKQDLHRIKARLNGAKKIADAEKQAKVLQAIEKDIAASIELRDKKRQNLPKINYPEQLPVSQKQDEIKKPLAKTKW